MRKIIYIVLISMMTSCSKYYQFTPNDTPPIPETWASVDEAYTNSEADLPCFPWWQQFEDPILNNLIDEGLLYNNDIQAALANIEASQGELKRIQLNWIPGITANAGYSSFPDLGFPGVLVNIVPSYILNIYKQIEEQKKAGFELKISQAIQDSIRLAIIAQIATNYFKLISQIEQLELLSTIENDLQSLLVISQNMYDTGLYPRMNPEKASTELHLIQAKKKLMQQNIVVYQNSIQYLLDKNPSFLNETTKFNQLDGNQVVIGALPFNVIESRPDMRQAAQELKAANVGINIAFSHLLPTIELRLARGEIATVPNGLKLGQAIHFNEGLLEIPILRASVFGQLEKAKGLNKASYYRYMDNLRRALCDIDSDLSAHDLYSKRFDEVVQAEQSLSKDYTLNSSLYQMGIISHFDLMEKNIKLTNLSLEVNQSKLEKFISIVELYHDLGVGYNYHPATSYCE